MSTTILCNLSDAQKVIDEERLYWISEILEALGVSDELFDATDIRDFRYGMEDIGIEVELHSNGNVDVYKKQWHEGLTEERSDWLPATEEHLVAQWKEPTYIRKVEGKNVHYELHLNEWSILNMRQNT
jgi:hypothetical protein